MTQQSKDIRATLGYKVDQGSIAAAQAANSKVAASFTDINSAVKALGTDILRLNPQLAAQTAQTNQAATAVNTLANNYKKVAVEAENALRFARADNTIGSGYGTVRSLGSAFGQIAGQGELGGVVSAISGLGLELGAVGLAMGGLAIVFRAITEETKRITEATNSRLSAEAELYRQLEEATRQDAILRREQAESMLELAQADRTRLGNAQVPLNGDLLLGFLTRLPGGGSALGGGEQAAYRDQIEKTELAITQSQAAIEFWTEQIDSNTVTVNTAAEAALASADRALEFDRLTREEREKLAQQIERDIAVLQAQATAAGKGSDAFIELTAEIEALKEQGAQLIPIAITYADVLEAEKDAKQALTDQSDAIQKGIEEQQAAEEKLRDATEAVTEAQADLTEALTEHDDNLRRIRSDQTEAEAKALTERIEDEQDARDKAAKDREKLDEEHGRRLQQIQDRYAQSREEALGNRDALALRAATVRRDTELKEERANYKERIDALDDALKEQLDVIKERYDDQLKTIRDAASKAIAAENERYRKQQQNLEAALNKAIAAEQYANNRLEALRSLNAFRAEYWAGVVETANKRMADSAAALAVSLWQSASLIDGAAGGSGSAGFPPLSDGSGNILNGQSGNALVGGFNVGGGLGDTLSGVSGGSINSASPRSGGGTFPGGGRALPSTFGGSQSKTIVFAPNIRSSMTPKEVQQLADDWFRRLRGVR